MGARNGSLKWTKTFKVDISSDLVYDALLAGCQNCYLREVINNHEDTIIQMLG
jgi:hypothetical protein